VGPVVLAVDVGGTTTAAGLVTEAGDVLADEAAPTHGQDTVGRTMERLIEALLRRAAAQRLPVLGLGVGIAGIVDPATGAVGEAHHVADLTGQRLADRLRERFGLPATVDNDVNALALGEHRFGLGRGARSLVVLAAGTGFGAGIVVEGRLVRGAHGFGGELGHVPVKFDGGPCWCGGRGCLALYASGRGIAEAARARVAAVAGAPLLRAAGGDAMAIDAPAVFAAAAAGDALAAAVVDEACRALGAMIAIVVNGLNPEVIVVTGGVAAPFARLEAAVLSAAAGHAFAAALAGTRVTIAPGDKRSSMRGAAALALEAGAGRWRDRPPLSPEGPAA
jgi:glucokinase